MMQTFAEPLLTVLQERGLKDVLISGNPTRQLLHRLSDSTASSIDVSSAHAQRHKRAEMTHLIIRRKEKFRTRSSHDSIRDRNLRLQRLSQLVQSSILQRIHERLARGDGRYLLCLLRGWRGEDAAAAVQRGCGQEEGWEEGECVHGVGSSRFLCFRWG